MKRTFFIFSLMVYTILAWADQYDQQYFEDAFVVQLEKSGSLSKALGKDIDGITCLQIQGELSDKDMKSLAKLTNLRKLSLRYANIEETKIFPAFQNLEVLFLPEKQHLPIEYMSMVPANQNLKVMLFCSFLDKQSTNGMYIRFSPFASLRKVIIAKMLDRITLDYKNYGVSSAEHEYIVVDTLEYVDSKLAKQKQQFRGRFEKKDGYVFYVDNEDVDFATIQAVQKPQTLRQNNTTPQVMRPIIPKILNLQKMEYIGEGYFNETEVEEITFSASALKLEERAFYGAKELKKIRFASSIQNLVIPASCFSECPKLESIIFDCPVTIEQSAFGAPNSERTIKSVTFNAPAKIEYSGINYAETIVFNALPIELNKDFANYSKILTPSGQDWFTNFLSWGININPDIEEVTFASADINPLSIVIQSAPKLKKITFSSAIDNLVIPSGAFANSPYIETLTFDCPVKMEWAAYNGYFNIGEIVFNKRATIKNGAFYGDTQLGKASSISRITFNNTTSIEDYGFITVDINEMIFNEMPNVLPKHFATCKNIQIPNIERAYDTFVSWGIASDYLVDPSANLALDIIVTEPGNILKYLPVDKLTQIKSLTITGHLYETDIAIIKQCTNLEYLNLADTYISESPTNQERRQAENKMWADIAELSIVDAGVKLETGQSTKRETKQQVAEAVRAAATMQKKDMPDCYIPFEAFMNMRLETVVLPKTVKQIHNSAFKGCKSLKNVELGESLMTIGTSAFENTQLVSISFPRTLKEIYGNAFDHVQTLKEIDLSQCTMTTVSSLQGINTHIGYNLLNLETFRMPQGLTTCDALLSFSNDITEYFPNFKDYYVGKDVKSIDKKIKNISLHFQSEMAPEIGRFGEVSNCTIYVPKNGNITSYYAKFNSNGNKIIQE